MNDINVDMRVLSKKDKIDLELIAPALRGMKAWEASRFGKSIKMIDDMVALQLTERLGSLKLHSRGPRGLAIHRD
eukprot:5487498-Heterocapsa_arctica.AAC.1